MQEYQIQGFCGGKLRLGSNCKLWFVCKNQVNRLLLNNI